MVSFDAREPGTPAQLWSADPRMTTLPSLGLDGVGELLVIAAHPDDETLGAGGLIAEAAARDIRVHIVIVTDGAASHPGSSGVEGESMALRRRIEAQVAARELAPGSRVTFLNLPDGQVREHREHLTDLLTPIITATGPSALIAAPWRGDGHRDHRVVGEVCADVSDRSHRTLIEYPIWMWHWASPDDATTPWPRLLALPLQTESLDAKRRAMLEYQSQVAPLSQAPGDEALLHPLFLLNFLRDIEVFVMPTADNSVPAERIAENYFDATYERHDDPWGFQTRWYEARKRALTMAALPAERYGAALEVGCSIGVLTRELAARTDRLLAVDISQAAVDRATARNADLPQVTVRKTDVVDHFPAGEFDLVVLSEVGYYFDLPSLTVVLGQIERSLGATGTLVACHWRHPVEDYLLTGDAVHAAIAEFTGLTRLSTVSEKDFILEVFSADPRSVAERTGLA
ncbi:bifunctional PIG-L family deacetylase/class I SAM-dependent methyltransferase [Glaciihabitans sp. dw_435]|uniref:bifunctional PIG-L family deacetylase/class I SAM-dependent methyltransferase n=1 Tax=Glaciihabitans sp. dw_435 TaxID=2720081 RepID=UPI001BD3C6C3|nr:bifunctional PIG-L family deacetylase/class I SAM-dependent methyltransferase [Glaciihabitans sp. dw_435]